MLKTLAAKHKSTVTAMAARYKAKIVTSAGPRTCFEARLRREGKKDLTGGPHWELGRRVLRGSLLVLCVI